MNAKQAEALSRLGEMLATEPANVLRLYEVPDAFEAIENQLIENGGELTPEIEAQLDALEGVFEVKVERICRIIRNNIASAKAFDDEIDRLKARKGAHENAADRLKEYLKRTLEQLGRDKLDAGIFKITLQLNGRPSIRWPGDVNDIPEPFKRTRVELDGDVAYDAWKHGRLPESFDVVRGKHLRIR